MIIKKIRIGVIFIYLVLKKNLIMGFVKRGIRIIVFKFIKVIIVNIVFNLFKLFNKFE